MATDIKAHIRITNEDTGACTEFDVGRPSLRGWSEVIRGWSIGSVGSESEIEIDEALEGLKLGIFLASNQVVLWGTCPEENADSLPEFAVQRWQYGEDTSKPRGLRSLFALFAEPEKRREWRTVDPTPSPREAGQLYVRFDDNPLRVGHSVIEVEMQSPASAF